jgi:site-specific recombinase XerD
MQVNFVYNRKNQLNREGEALIQTKVYLSRKSYKFESTGIHVKPEQWDPRKQTIVKHPDKVRLNAILSNIRKKYQDAELDLIRKYGTVTMQRLQAYVNHESDNYSLIRFLRDEIKKSSISDDTKRGHRTLPNELEKWGKMTSLQDVTLENIYEFDRHIRSHTGAYSTVHNYHKRLRKYLNIARNKELIFDNPYDRFPMKSPKHSQRKYLTEAELRRIEEKEINIDRLDQVRDIFVFACYTGLSYKDLRSLSEKDIFTDEKGSRYIEFYRKKTGERSYIPILKKPSQILKKYASNERLLPVPSDQRYNGYLKEIAIICGIDKNLTSHVARHTFATTVTLANGISLEVVKNMLGHTDIKTTEIYAKMIRKRVDDEMRNLDD